MKKEIAKAAVLLLVIAGAAWCHQRARKQQGLSWREYGGRMLIGREGKGHVPQYDFLRALTTLLVLLYHSAAMAQGKMNGELSVSGGILSAVVILSYSCNMLFVALSGALVLPWREESAARFYARRFSRVVIPLILYYLFYLRCTGGLVLSPASFLAAARTIVRGPDNWTPHFWLIYTILGLYLSAPFLRYALKHMPEQALKGTGVLILAGASVKTLCTFFYIEWGLNSFLFDWTGVFVLGYLAARPMERRQEKLLQAAGAVSAAVLVLLFWFWPQFGPQLAFESPFMMLFVWAVMRSVGRRRRKNGIAVRLVSRYSYSILLIHWYIMFIWGEGTLGLTPFLWGEEQVLAGILWQVSVSLGLSLSFAVVFDQTAVILARSLWESLLAFCRRKRGIDVIL